MASAALVEKHEKRRSDPVSVRTYCWLITVLFVGVLVWLSFIQATEHAAKPAELAGWIVLVGVADALRVRLWDEFSFAISFPISLASAILLPPWQAGLVAALGSLDGREAKAEVPLARALFNRAEVGLSVLLAGLLFQGLGGEPTWPELLGPSLIAGLADLAANTAIVAPAVVWLHRSSIREVLRRAIGPNPTQFATIYLCLWLLAPLTAIAYLQAGLLGVGLVVVPAALARLAFVQAIRVSAASEDLEAKRIALQAATDQAAQERRDERRMLAGELHDDVLPALFKVHLMGEVLRKDLEQGRLLDLEADVPELAVATDTAQKAIRRVMNDLRHSSLGRDGLVATLRLLAKSLEASSSARFLLELEAVPTVDHLSQLVAYQVAREAMTNAARYSHAEVIHVRLAETDDRLRLVVSDGGVGFAPNEIDIKDHLGLQLMRERVESLGGQLAIDSRLGVGTTVVATVPLQPL